MGISVEGLEVWLTSRNRRIILLIMKLIRPVIRAGAVWLTALMTLVTGLPHFVCICPDGHRKPFCLGFCSPTTGCCCASECCARSEAPSSPNADTMETCCSCHHKARSSNTKQVPHAQLASQGCRKTIVQADFAIVTTGWRTAVDPSALVFPVPALDSVVKGPCPFDLDGRFAWRSCRIPPPTDLVVTLKHLLI